MNRIDFTYNGWDYWFHPLQGWGAILSRKGLQPIIIHAATREELIQRIDGLNQAPQYRLGTPTTKNSGYRRLSAFPAEPIRPSISFPACEQYLLA